MATKKKAAPKKVTKKSAPKKAAAVKKPEPVGLWYVGHMMNPVLGYRANDISISPVAYGYSTYEEALSASEKKVSGAKLPVVVFVSKVV